MPEQVWDELLAGEDGVQELRSAYDRGNLEIVSIEETALFDEFRHNLDVGEAATLAYAIENDAELVLLDERAARQTARRHDLTMTGVVGILLRGNRHGTVDIRKELDRLRDTGFWISDALYAKAIEQSEEW